MRLKNPKPGINQGINPSEKKKKKNRETKDAIVVPVRLPLSCKTPKLLLPFYNAIA